MVKRTRLSYANVMATIAVFVSLGGGAYAAITLPRNSVGETQIKKGAVTSSKVRDRSLTAKDFKSGELKAGPEGPRGLPGNPGTPGSPGSPGAPGPSEGYAKTYASAPATCSAGVICTTSSAGPALPAGTYAIFATLNPRISEADSYVVELSCTLKAGTTADTVRTTFYDQSTTFAESHSMALQLVHTYAEPGTPTLACSRPNSGPLPAIENVRFTAIRLGRDAS
jgi:hypothetical protein